METERQHLIVKEENGAGDKEKFDSAVADLDLESQNRKESVRDCELRDYSDESENDAV